MYSGFSVACSYQSLSISVPLTVHAYPTNCFISNFAASPSTVSVVVGSSATSYISTLSVDPSCGSLQYVLATSTSFATFDSSTKLATFAPTLSSDSGTHSVIFEIKNETITIARVTVTINVSCVVASLSPLGTVVN